MQSFLGCDAHKHYSVFVAVDEGGRASKPVRIEHNMAAHRRYLDALPAGTEIALESTTYWYWIVDLMEQAGHRPHLADAFEAKKRMGKTHKTDAPSMPKDWPSCCVAELCRRVGFPLANCATSASLLRTRMALRDLRTSLKHRIHSAIDQATACKPLASPTSSASRAAPTLLGRSPICRPRPRAWWRSNSVHRSTQRQAPDP